MKQDEKNLSLTDHNIEDEINFTIKSMWHQSCWDVPFINWRWGRVIEHHQAGVSIAHIVIIFFYSQFTRLSIISTTMRVLSNVSMAHKSMERPLKMYSLFGSMNRVARLFSSTIYCTRNFSVDKIFCITLMRINYSETRLSRLWLEIVQLFI